MSNVITRSYFDNWSDNPCLGCPTNPANGGSGVCNCTLPDYYQKRWTGNNKFDYWETMEKSEPTRYYNTVISTTSTDLVFNDKKEKSTSIILNNHIKKIIKVPCHVKKGNNNG